jgi:hypothetical protein
VSAFESTQARQVSQKSDARPWSTMFPAPRKAARAGPSRPANARKIAVPRRVSRRTRPRTSRRPPATTRPRIALAASAISTMDHEPSNAWCGQKVAERGGEDDHPPAADGREQERRGEDGVGREEDRGLDDREDEVRARPLRRGSSRRRRGARRSRCGERTSRRGLRVGASRSARRVGRARDRSGALPRPRSPERRLTANPSLQDLLARAPPRGRDADPRSRGEDRDRRGTCYCGRGGTSARLGSYPADFIAE